MALEFKHVQAVGGGGGGIEVGQCTSKLILAFKLVRGIGTYWARKHTSI